VVTPVRVLVQAKRDGVVKSGRTQYEL
jgi:hypothetical protein